MYIHWPLNGNLNASHNLAAPPTLTVPAGTSKLWSRAGWMTFDGTTYAAAGATADLRTLLDVSTLGDGMIFLAYWIARDDEAWRSMSNAYHLAYGVQGATMGILVRAIQNVTNGMRWQSRVGTGSGFTSVDDVSEIKDGFRDRLHFMHVIRNRGGDTECSNFVNGFQTSQTKIIAGAWAQGSDFDNGICFGTELFANGAPSATRLDDNVRMRDLVLVRTARTDWENIDVLARDMWRRDGGLPDSWGLYL